jgi:hypothetical protein
MQSQERDVKRETHHIKKIISQAWWYLPVIPALRRQKQEDCQFEASLVYTVRPCLKKQTNKALPPQKKERKKESSPNKCTKIMQFQQNSNQMGGSAIGS